MNRRGDLLDAGVHVPGEEFDRPIEPVAALGPLRDDLDLDAATDVLWLLKDPALYTALVGDRGWPAERYRAWLAHTMQASLLPAQASRQNRTP